MGDGLASLMNVRLVQLVVCNILELLMELAHPMDCLIVILAILILHAIHMKLAKGESV